MVEQDSLKTHGTCMSDKHKLYKYSETVIHVSITNCSVVKSDDFQ